MNLRIVLLLSITVLASQLVGSSSQQRQFIASATGFVLEHNVNDYECDYVPLHRLAIFSRALAIKGLTSQANHLVAAGAMLSLPVRGHGQWSGYTAAQIIKKQLHEHRNHHAVLNAMQALRACLVSASLYRRIGLKGDLAVYFPPVLSSLIAQYYCADEDRYEVLEATVPPQPTEKKEVFTMPMVEQRVSFRWSSFFSPPV